MKIKYIPVFLLMLTTSLGLFAEESDLTESKSYRLEKTISIEPVSSGCTVTTPNPKHAGKASKFEVVKKEDGCDIIRFWSVYSSGDIEADKIVDEDVEYVLPTNINGVPISSSTTRSGKTSGLLVVPYKYRNDDGAITGEATVGYYAGWETRLGTLLLSAGLSQVSIPVSETENENQSAVTLAAGYLLSNWDSIDLGLVVGIDHIGGSKGEDWQYEDDPWFSLMIGWNFSQ